jgi:hypothetical protein
LLKFLNACPAGFFVEFFLLVFCQGLGRVGRQLRVGRLVVIQISRLFGGEGEGSGFSFSGGESGLFFFFLMLYFFL